MWRPLLVALLVLTGCKGDPVVTCLDDNRCLAEGVRGKCVASPTSAGTSFCAFPAAKCPSGYEWDRTAAADLVGTCAVLDPSGNDLTMTLDLAGSDGASPPPDATVVDGGVILDGVILDGVILDGAILDGAALDLAVPNDLASLPDLKPPGDLTVLPDLKPLQDLAVPPDLAPVLLLHRPSKSSTIALSDDDAIVAVTNPEDDSVSFFITATNTRVSKVTTGKEPSSVVIHPDNNTAYVANRADATVVKVSNIGSGAPTVSAPINVGSEPTGLALSPTGAKLFVAEYAEGSVGVIDTATMSRTAFAVGLRNPRSIAVTNDNDNLDSDETVIVPEFFGEPVNGKEARNDGRTGAVHLFTVGGTVLGKVTLAPFTNTDATLETLTSPNQLYAVAVDGDRFYVPSVSASPNLPSLSDKNVYPVVYVGNLTTRVEDKTGVGTTNLAQLVTPLPAATGGGVATRWFLGDLVDLDFKAGTKTAYAVSRASEVVQRIDYGGTSTTIGSSMNKQINILGAGATTCQQPSGIVVARTTALAYVNCWVTRRLAVLNLSTQAVQAVVDSAALPTLGSQADQINRGRHFFYTGRGRWSGNATGSAAGQDATENGSAWSSCGSCHPDGLTDNITWIFGTGPRQSTSLDGSFSHGTGGPKRRIFNWTAIIDEVHDFENNVRAVSGGKGAITTSTTCGTLSLEIRSSVGGLIGTPVAKDLQNTQTNNCVRDWDDVEAFVAAIRPPRALRFGDPLSVGRGAMLFANKANCVNCHGGPGWTVSNRFYTPSNANNGAAGTGGLMDRAFFKPPAYSVFASNNATQVAAQEISQDLIVPAPIPPTQLTCALRNVGTFGVPGDIPGTDVLETRAGYLVNGMTYTRAQGRGGYNVPSLYGLSLGSPYLHHGQARTLVDLFTDVRWKSHWAAGNANFLSDGSAVQDRIDLINFLLTIDAGTAEQPVPMGFADGCLCRDSTNPPAPPASCAP